MTSTTRSKIIDIIAEQALLEPSDVTPDLTLDDLGLDSMAVVESIFAMEEAFGIEIPFNANEPDKGGFDLSSVGAIIDAVEALVATKQ